MNKGFTLIELLAVIVILAIILLIAVPQVLSVIDDARINAYKSDKEFVTKAAELYIVTNDISMPSNLGDTIEISLSDLITSGLQEEIKSPFNSNSCVGYVLITKTGEESYSYDPQINCIDNTITSRSLDGLVGYWKFDGNLYDYALTNHGIPTNITYDSSKSVKGQAISLNGTTSYVEVLDDPTFDFSSLTLSAWVNFNITEVTNWMLIDKGPANVSSSYYLFGYSETPFLSNYYEFSFFDTVPGRFDIHYNTMDLEKEKWYYFTVTHETSTKITRIYLNGKEVDSLSGFSILNNNYNYLFGKYELDSYFLDGNIDEIRIYNRALSSEEIKVLYDEYK